jgi:hypothetical protein
VWVLRSKYVKERELIPISQAKKRDSALWKGICKVWLFVTRGLNWALGCGSKVLFWKDMAPLNQHTIPIQDIPKNLLKCSVADMVDDGGQW